jgi:hypothetical protein
VKVLWAIILNGGNSDGGKDAREQFRTELEFALMPLRDEKRANYDGALTFAEAAIKSAFALNGGGIVALPALTALLKIEPKPAATCIIVAVGAFVVGLVCAAATSFLGYLSAMTNVHGLEQSADHCVIRLHL